MRRLNILVSTTRQWNPGDDFIYYGARRILEAQLGAELNYHLWDRNPDRSADLTKDWVFRTDMMSNLTNEGALAHMDAILLAGTPHWTGGMLEPVYAHLLSNPDKPCFALGLGSSSRLDRLSDVEIGALARRSTLITTRSDELAEDIDLILGLRKAVSLPCPAFLSAADTTDEETAHCLGAVQAREQRAPLQEARKDKLRIGLILQAPGVKWQEIGEDHFDDIIRAMGPEPFDVEVVSVYGPEFAELKKRRVGAEIIYSFEASDYARLLRRYDVVISTRLHGAIGALGLGVPAILLDREDFRVNSAQAKLAEILPLMRPGEAFSFARSVAVPSLSVWRQKINVTRREVLASYAGLVGSHVRSSSFGPAACR